MSGQRAARASIWVLSSHFAQTVIRVATNLILTRLLFPEAFGIMAIIQTLATGLELFSDIGLGPSIIRSPHYREPEFQNAVWTLATIRGMFLWVAACLLAYPLAQFMSEPELALMIPVAAMSTLLIGMESTYLAADARDMRWGRRTAVNMISQVIGVVVMIGLSLAWRSPWALVVGQVVAALLRCLLSHWVCRANRLRFSWNSEVNTEILHFGKWVFLTTILTFLSGQLDLLFVGKLFSVGFLGIFSLARGFAALPVDISMKLQISVLYPLMAGKNCEGGSLRSALTKYKLLVIAPLMCLLALGAAHAPFIIEHLYDSRYWEAGWMLKLMLITSALEMPFSAATALPLTYGRPRLATGHMAVNTAVSLFAMWIGWLTMSPGIYLIVLMMGRAVPVAALWYIFRVFELNTFLVDLILLTLYAAVQMAAFLPHYLGISSLPMVLLTGVVLPSACWAIFYYWLLRWQDIQLGVYLLGRAPLAAPGFKSVATDPAE